MRHLGQAPKCKKIFPIWEGSLNDPSIQPVEPLAKPIAHYQWAKKGDVSEGGFGANLSCADYTALSKLTLPKARKFAVFYSWWAIIDYDVA